MKTYLGDNAPDLLCMDAEGFDFKILKSLDFLKYRPCIIVAENRSSEFITFISQLFFLCLLGLAFLISFNVFYVFRLFYWTKDARCKKHRFEKVLVLAEYNRKSWVSRNF